MAFAICSVRETSPLWALKRRKCTLESSLHVQLVDIIPFAFSRRLVSQPIALHLAV